MKKALSLLFAAALLTACGYSDKEKEEMKKESTEQTDAAADDIMNELGGSDSTSSDSAAHSTDSVKTK